MRAVKIKIRTQSLTRFCRRMGIKRLALFGSILTENFRPESDIDVLVEFSPGHAPGFFGLAKMERELSELLGRKADIRTPQDLSKYFRDDVIAGAEVLYAEE